jgi:hypothetical protein
VNTEVVKLAEHYAAGWIEGRGHFSVPREVFCYVDHLGELAFGGPSTARAVRFIREFFPSRYHTWAELLYAMWRHGTVHAHKPYSYRAPLPGSMTVVEVRWLSANHNRPRERSVHLLVFPIDGHPNAVSLVVNTCQLAHDLLLAIDSFIGRLRSDPELKADCDKRLAALAPIRDHTSVDSKTRQQTIAKEIESVWASRGGLIDETGNIIAPHPKEYGSEVPAQQVAPADADPRRG